MKVGLPLEKRDRHFTYRDYLDWPDDERWELIGGVAYNMCAAPNRAHQRVSGELFTQIKLWLNGKPCRVYAAPFDVLLPAWPEQTEDEIDTVVQPDIVVYCDRSRLTQAGAKGAPTLAVEILSPWTSKKDLNEKFRLYEQVGVEEYWVLDPASHSLQLYCRDGERFGEAKIFVGGGLAESRILPGFRCEVSALFEDD